MVRYLEEFAHRNRLRVEYDTDVRRITRTGRFELETSRGRYTADRLIVATGMGADNVPAIPGIDFAESYRTMSTDPRDFQGQRVMILGKGNSAFETANNLVETTAAIHLVSPTPIRMAWRTHFVGHLRAVNNNVLDTYQLKSQNTILDADVEEIRPDGDMLAVPIRYRHAHDQRIVVRVHRVLRCTGFKMDTAIFDGSCAPELAVNDRFPKLTTAWESTNVPDLYFAGTLTQSRDYQRHFSAFIHGFRYNVEALTRLLLERYHATPWPMRALDGPEGVMPAMMERVNNSSVLFQQPGFLGDVVRVRDGQVSYVESYPVDRFLEQVESQCKQLALMLTLEYGREDHPDPFNIERFPEDGSKSFFIHPVVRVYRGGMQTAEHHVAEDLENDWSSPFYLAPLRRFLDDQLAASHARVPAR
jgi:thioredoxin reductase